MKKIILGLLLVTTVHNHIAAQNFNSFIASVPEIKLVTETDLRKENDVNKIPVAATDAMSILKESEGEHFIIGKIILSKSTAVIYYSKPQGSVPFGKVSVITINAAGKKVSSEAIGVFSDFSGMRFHMTLIASAQVKGNISLTSNVKAMKEDGEINKSMSKISIYVIAPKGKILKM
jgi:hypothetical protein